LHRLLVALQHSQQGLLTPLAGGSPGALPPEPALQFVPHYSEDRPQ
jgi:hypothetical protein